MPLKPGCLGWLGWAFHHQYDKAEEPTEGEAPPLSPPSPKNATIPDIA